jgi:hypothetical protein
MSHSYVDIYLIFILKICPFWLFNLDKISLLWAQTTRKEHKIPAEFPQLSTVACSKVETSCCSMTRSTINVANPALSKDRSPSKGMMFLKCKHTYTQHHSSHCTCLTLSHTTGKKSWESEIKNTYLHWWRYICGSIDLLHFGSIFQKAWTSFEVWRGIIKPDCDHADNHSFHIESCSSNGLQVVPVKEDTRGATWWEKMPSFHSCRQF